MGTRQTASTQQAEYETVIGKVHNSCGSKSDSSSAGGFSELLLQAEVLFLVGCRLGRRVLPVDRLARKEEPVSFLIGDMFGVNGQVPGGLQQLVRLGELDVLLNPVKWSPE